MNYLKLFHKIKILTLIILKIEEVNLIGGGKPTTIEKWPWHTFLVVRDPYKIRFSCGGVLISRCYVMTVASCFPRGYNHVLLVLGATNVTQFVSGKAHKRHINAKRVFVHPEYSFPYYRRNDIALILMDKQLYFTSRINKIKLVFTPILRLHEYEATLQGYGWNESMFIEILVSFINFNLTTPRIRNTVDTSYCKCRYCER